MFLRVEIDSSRKEMREHLEAGTDRSRQRVMRKFENFSKQQGCLSLQ